MRHRGIMKCVPLTSANATHHGLLPSFSPHLLKPNPYLMDGDHHVSLPRTELLVLPRHIAPVSSLRTSTTERISQMTVLLQTRSIREVYSEAVIAHFELSLASFPIWRLSNACGRHVKNQASLIQTRLAPSRFRGLLNFATNSDGWENALKMMGFQNPDVMSKSSVGYCEVQPYTFSHVTDRSIFVPQHDVKMVVNLTFPPLLCDRDPKIANSKPRTNLSHLKDRVFATPLPLTVPYREPL